jgi:cobalt-zinc-cadmium efflux system membrane fusion protein
MRNAVPLATLLLAAFCAIRCGGEKEGERTNASATGPREERIVRLTDDQERTAGLVVRAAGESGVGRQLRLTGEVEYGTDRVARVSARIGGRIEKVLVDLGSRVNPGDVLALVDSPDMGDAEAAYMKSTAAHVAAASSLQRARLLREGEAISLAELQQRQAQESAARAEMLYAEKRLRLLGLDGAKIRQLRQSALTGEDSTDPSKPQDTGAPPGINPVYPVRSPLAGIVTERAAGPGEVIGPDAHLFTIANLSVVQVFFNVFEKDSAVVRPGLPVSFSTEALPGRSFEGRVDFVSPSVDETSRSVRARAVIPNPHGLLRNGMFVTAVLALPSIQGLKDDSREVTVPVDAVVELDGGPHVFVRIEPRAYRAVPVTVGRRDDNAAWIRSGIRPDDQVVIEGAFTLKSELKRHTLMETD